MKLRTVFLLGVIGAAVLAMANAKDLQRYLRLRNM